MHANQYQSRARPVPTAQKPNPEADAVRRLMLDMERMEEQLQLIGSQIRAMIEERQLERQLEFMLATSQLEVPRVPEAPESATPAQA